MRQLRALAWLGGLLPLLLLLAAALRDGLGANPIEAITHRTGRGALVLLLVTLAVTPVRRLTGWNRVAPLRRTFGLFAFFYATLHFATYVTLDHFFDLATIVEDVLRRPFITAGFVAFVLLIPLAATSTQAAMRRLGRRWQSLHRLVYVAAGLGVLHFFWKVKADTREPLIYAAVLGTLLVVRLLPPRLLRPRTRRRTPPTAATAPPAAAARTCQSGVDEGS